MSDTVRSYGGNKQSLGLGAPRPSRGGLLPGLMGVVAAGFVAFLWWISRDLHKIEEFLPAAQSVQVRVQHAVSARESLAASPAWAVLPAELRAQWRDPLQEPLPVPQWLAKNLFNRELYWFANGESGEGVLVSRITRVGAIAARLAPFLPVVSRDWAGGLNISTIEEEGLHFAVRGRILIASNSRRAVINALTLAEEERAELTGYLVQAPEEAQISGVAQLDEVFAQRLGVERIEFGIITEGSRFALIARGHLDRTASETANLIANAPATSLSAPDAAPAALVINLGAPLETVSLVLADAFGSDWPDEAQWAEWSSPPQNDPLRPGVGELLAQLGPELQFTIHDVDPKEVLPVPELVIRTATPSDGLPELLQAFPAPSIGPSLEAVRASFDSESGILRIPAPGGDSLEPSAAFHGESFAFSTSLSRLSKILSKPEAPKKLPGAGIAYLRIEPAALLETLSTAGRVLAESALLKGHTVESFEKEAAAWREQIQSVQSVEAVLRRSEDTVVLESEVRFTGQ